MFKKTAKSLKVLFIGVLWTAAFLYAARLILIYIWHFDIFYRKQWGVLSGYWNNNGVIMSGTDYLFFLTLLILVLVWGIGWRLLAKANYLKLLLYPFEYFNNYEIKKYENVDTHVVIKNIAVSEKLTVEDVIQERIKKEKVNKVKEADQLRRNISEKIIKRKE